MYIRLGNTKINYRAANADKYMIFSEVVDSSLSYESPVIVNSISELNALFSKDFKDYIYLKRVLESYGNVGLYLFKPFSPIKSKVALEQEGYIDYSRFTLIEPYDIFSPSTEYINYFTDWKNDSRMAIGVFNDEYDFSSGIHYEVLNNGVWENIDNPKVVFKGEPVVESKLYQFKTLRESDEICIKIDGELWVYCGSYGFVLETDLPQNIADLTNSKSLDNRSTLFIPNLDGIDYIHPEYVNKKGLGLFSYNNLPTIPLSKINTDRIREGRETLALRLSISSSNINCLGSLAFLDITDGVKKCISFSNDGNSIDLSPENNIKYSLISYSSSLILEDIKAQLDQLYPNCTFWDNDDLIICGRVMIDLGYNTFSGISVKPDYEISQGIIYKSLPSGTSGVGFWSKTIGGTSDLDEDGVIKIQIEDAGNEEFLVVISRYDYSETFQGKIIPTLGQDRLDNIINKYSKLLHMELINNAKDMNTGTFFMSKGKYVKDYSNEDWMNSLEMMFGIDNKNVNTDFLLIPNIQDYISSSSLNDSSYYKEYETILNYCKDGSFQALIQNRDSKYGFKEIEDISELADHSENTIYYVPENIELEEYLSNGITKTTENSIVLDFDRTNQECYYKEGDDVVDSKIRTVIFSKDCTSTIYVQVDHFLTSETGFDWSSYFPDGFTLCFKNESNFQQVVKAPKRIEQETVGDSLVQEFILNPEEILVMQIVHKTTGVFHWVKVNYDSGYYLSDENKNITKITDKNLIEDAVYGGDYAYNYLSDTDNRLVYFFRSIYTTTFEIEYPGYCVFLDGILTGNYSGSVNSIIYKPPVINPYEESSIEKVLEKYKSNYLVFNGQKYFYKKYFEGTDRNTSIFLRFIIGKITREFMKHKYSLIGERVLGKIRQAVTDLLLEIKNKFSIVEDIKLQSFEPDIKSSSLNIGISTSVKNLLDKDVIINIILNLDK